MRAKVLLLHSKHVWVSHRSAGEGDVGVWIGNLRWAAHDVWVLCLAVGELRGL